MQAIHLKTNHLTAPMGIDAGPLFLSWQCADGLHQTAYEIELSVNGARAWHSGKVPGAAMYAEAPAVALSRARGCWKIRLWDETGRPGPWAEATFETGLAAGDWQGRWVEPEPDDIEIPGDDAINAFARPNWEHKQAEQAAAGKGPAQPYEPHRPASYLKRTFTAPAGRARLYITARGLYVAWLNGARVGDIVLAPGSFTGDKHLGAQTYDVTALLREGENELLIALGDGWYRSTSGVNGDRNLFGTTLGVLFQLEVDGAPVCVSDETMLATQQGPIRQNDLQQGEVYDARKEGALTGWHGIKTAANTLTITGMNTLPVREKEAFAARRFQTPNGETVLDFGQNIAGYVEIALHAHAGQKVRLTCGETLDENGNFTQENFQDRARHQEGGTAQMLELICKEGANHWKPSFTIMGFRYAKVETDADLTGAKFTAHAVYSDMAVTGQFTCGRDDVNQLVQNSVWSQKGNFCDIPTDCPTRERAGWTGDMGVFIETGLTLMDCYPVVEKWLAECRLNQYPDGRMANIAPPSGRPGPMTPMLCMSAGWGDAAILVPWAVYRRTGDRRILADNYEMMQRWYAFLLGRAQQTTPEQQDGAYAKYTVLNGLDYGEWCEPGITPMQAMMNLRKSVGTAYLAYSGRLLADVAQALGRAQDAETYRDGMGVPERGWAGTARGDGERLYPSFRLYAGNLDGVTSLQDFLGTRNIDVYTRAEEIENVKMLDRSTTLVFGLICLAAGVGFLASTASNLVAAIRRKRRVLGIIRLMGFSGADIVCFPLMQTLFTSALGMGLAFTLYAAVAGVINALFPLGAELGAVCRLSWAHVGGAAGVVLALSLLAALPPSLSCSRLSPSEVIRNE